MYAWGEENNITMNVLSFLIVGVAANSVEGLVKLRVKGQFLIWASWSV